jgi:hypothetical protein
VLSSERTLPGRPVRTLPGPQGAARRGAVRHAVLSRSVGLLGLPVVEDVTSRDHPSSVEESPESGGSASRRSAVAGAPAGPLPAPPAAPGRRSSC